MRGHNTMPWLSTFVTLLLAVDARRLVAKSEARISHDSGGSVVALGQGSSSHCVFIKTDAGRVSVIQITTNNEPYGAGMVVNELADVSDDTGRHLVRSTVTQRVCPALVSRDTLQKLEVWLGWNLTQSLVMKTCKDDTNEIMTPTRSNPDNVLLYCGFSWRTTILEFAIDGKLLIDNSVAELTEEADHDCMRLFECRQSCTFTCCDVVGDKADFGRQ